MAGNRLLRGQNLAGRGWLLCSSNLLLFEPPTAESMQCFLKHTETQDTLFLPPAPSSSAGGEGMAGGDTAPVGHFQEDADGCVQ